MLSSFPTDVPPIVDAPLFSLDYHSTRSPQFLPPVFLYPRFPTSFPPILVKRLVPLSAHFLGTALTNTTLRLLEPHVVPFPSSVFFKSIVRTTFEFPSIQQRIMAFFIFHGMLLPSVASMTVPPAIPKPSSDFPLIPLPPPFFNFPECFGPIGLHNPSTPSRKEEPLWSSRGSSFTVRCVRPAITRSHSDQSEEFSLTLSPHQILSTDVSYLAKPPSLWLEARRRRRNVLIFYIPSLPFVQPKILPHTFVLLRLFVSLVFHAFLLSRFLSSMSLIQCNFPR